MKQRFLLPFVATAALAGIGVYVYGHNINATCVPGNADFEAGTGLCNAKNRAALNAKAEADAAKAAKAKAEAQAEAEKQAERKAAQEKAQAERDAAEAKFKAEGWWEAQDGIYVRWCTQTCSTADTYSRGAYWLMEVWAKDRAAGDIYAQINIEKDGTVVGWTNDRLFLSKGQKGVLTFNKYGIDNPAAYQASLTKFNARGSW